MNVVPGSSFFRPTPGNAQQTTAPQTNPSRPGASTNAALQAQTATDDRRGQPGANQQTAQSRPPSAPFGPRGSIIDIVA